MNPAGKPFKVVALVSVVAVCLLMVAISVLRNVAHVRSFNSVRATANDDMRARLHSLVERGSELRESGRYKEAEPPLKEALTIAEEAFGPTSFETVVVLNQLGVLGKYDGNFDEAEAAYKRALRIMEQTSGLENEMSATLFHNLGRARTRAWQFLQQVSLMRVDRSRSANDFVGQTTPKQQRMSLRSPRFSTVKGSTRKPNRCIGAHFRFLKRRMGRRITMWPINLNNLAALCQNTGRMEEAEALYLRALDIKKKLLGDSHPDVAVTLNNLAMFYKAEGKLQQSAEMYRRAIEIFKQTLDPSHPKLKLCEQNYEQLLREMGQM
jgi:tetratricopeptide (TPR) repeat protein